MQLFLYPRNDLPCKSLLDRRVSLTTNHCWCIASPILDSALRSRKAVLDRSSRLDRFVQVLQGSVTADASLSLRVSFQVT